MSEEKQVLAGVPGPGNTEPEVAPESKCPVMHGNRRPTSTSWAPIQCRLVAESAEFENASPELTSVQSHGQRI